MSNDGDAHMADDNDDNNDDDYVDAASANDDDYKNDLISFSLLLL